MLSVVRVDSARKKCYPFLMPTITDLQIQKNNKTRANVYIDGEFNCALEMLTVMKLGLKIGQPITPERLKEASLDSERAVAFDKALNYLARGSKTVHQMREYLAKRRYDAEVTEYVIAKLKDYRYLDDEAYARAYAEQNAPTKGNRRLKRELVAKGISVTIAERHSEEDPESALSNAARLAEKYMRSKPCDLKTLQKLQRYLLSRGYGYDTVNSVLRAYNVTDES